MTTVTDNLCKPSTESTQKKDKKMQPFIVILLPNKSHFKTIIIIINAYIR
ncbi:hypothetical protein HMPREF0765_0540 [Sphingobacterium spiritivorum ATCC 33300]|uniref:Uncharacterized protein n=1 Tax=Sphingobacterium spiritivorum ATCC 33300 TaxID=525372 RepID=C2FT84_SPHSI|nr:hypothetical protein HMPREF0765_0540 [Sphingobacterium spiritivorum ATCC 33300]